LRLIDINSGYTVRDGEWPVGSGPLGDVELLTLTLSFPSNRKRYDILPGCLRLLTRPSCGIADARTSKLWDWPWPRHTNG